MALEDPFSAVRREVQKAVNTARGLYGRWCELLQETRVVSAEEFDWTTNELHNSLRSIEWDLEDLEETIRIVDSNPRKFRIEASELTERRAFVKQMRDSVKEMRDHVSSPSALAVTERKNREMLIGGGASQKPPLEQYGPLRAELVSANSRYIEEQQLHQQLIIDQQDEQLELVSGSIRVLKHMSGQVGDELEEQSLPAPVVCDWHSARSPHRGAYPLLRSVIDWPGLRGGGGGRQHSPDHPPLHAHASILAWQAAWELPTRCLSLTLGAGTCGERNGTSRYQGRFLLEIWFRSPPAFASTAGASSACRGSSNVLEWEGASDLSPDLGGRGSQLIGTSTPHLQS
ncbi:syntaxin-10 isoform X3 [Dermochelys coriacea]|uniref:syntaxin-10 isoform X3 n=1 Tax=Dermochelys coriacea TaxID=27794 RepID=UPI001CA8FA51|nr:syntaxin-10 isoform X3 [Dermochelys coriacea]